MSWLRAYRFALRLLPAELRRKHGAAMATLFARELRRSRAGGRLGTALVGLAGVADVQASSSPNPRSRWCTWPERVSSSSR